MWLFIFLVLKFAAVEIQASNGYKVDHEKIGITYFNKEHISAFEAKLFDYNSTSKAYNISGTIVKQLPMDFKVAFQFFKMINNQYRLIPTRFTPTYCDMFERNDFGVQGIFKYGNVTTCPLKRGTYYTANFIIDDNKIPEQLLIPGKYKIIGKVVNKTVHFSSFEWYVGIINKN